MKRLLWLLITLLWLCADTRGQNTPEALGNTTFHCFQQSNLDSFFLLLPTLPEIIEFGISIGVDTTTNDFKQFVNEYPNEISTFKKKCKRILHDDLDANFRWALATLDKVQKSQFDIPIDEHDPNSKTITLTVIDIYFYVNKLRYKLSLGDANAYNGIWKPGNQISLIQF